MKNLNQSERFPVFMRTSEQIKTEIENKFGYFPPFFAPAQQNLQVLENLWQQTLNADVNSRLPPLFREKLATYLSRYCNISYLVVFHSCCLYSLGIKAQEVLELLKSPPPIETDIDAYLRTLALTPDIFTALLTNPTVEESLLYCSIFIFLEQDQADYCQNELRRILGSRDYQYLVTFIAYIKTCHMWIEAYPDVNYEADKRIQENLTALLEEEPVLADFFSNYQEHVRRERQTEQLVQDSNRQQAEAALRQQIERERLVVEMAQRIRKSLDLNEILNTTVSEVRQFLQVDRVFIYRFEPDWSGIIIVESVGSGWQSMLGSTLKDPTFAEAYIQPYKHGRIQATADIYAGGLTPCYIEFLAQFQARADLVVPILQGEELWGLLVANHCLAPRQWQQLEIDLLKQLATQVAIAIQQSELYQLSLSELNYRQRAEQALAVSLAQIQEQVTLLDQSQDAILVLNMEGHICFWNKSANRLLGWTTTEAIGTKIEQLLGFKHSPQLEAAQNAVSHVGEWHGELHPVTKSGQEIVVESRWTLVRDSEDKPKSILVINTDITKKKQLEAQFLRAQRMESIGTLAGGIAHDLNNVLTPIIASAQLLLSNQLNEQKRQRLLTTIETSAKRGAALVKQVLSFSRGIEGKFSILQLSHLISEIRQIVKETFPKAIEFTMLLPPELWVVSGDATQLHQVFMNLCVNARDAMPYGGTLEIRAENLFIDHNYAQMHLEAQVG
ncbi:MAG: GAF domain-containing protein, partial [Chroococcidiopsidaceae cyanobacterium CP_BM_ER_R8_30]|nr:GAF domain-containing protein [Chroococcidiopsidaceae cyanobacterium CP_BM_ER_R8_30]